MSADSNIPAGLAKLRDAARAVGVVAPRKMPTPTNLIRRKGFPYVAPTVPRGVEPSAKPRTSGADYDTDWARTAPARAARGAILEGILRPAIRGLAKPEIFGVDRLNGLPDDESPVIFVANHHSHIDTPLLLSVIPRPRRYKMVVGAAADYFFTTRMQSAFFSLTLGTIPIERQKVGRASANLAQSLIEDGYSLLLFPEGGRSPDGWGQPFRGGAAFLATRVGVPVVPIHVEGTGQILGKGDSFPKRGKTRVTFGSPIFPSGHDARTLGVAVEKAIAELADEAMTDWWGARQRAAAGSTPSLAGPTAVSSWRRQWALPDKTKRTASKRSWPNI